MNLALGVELLGLEIVPQHCSQHEEDLDLNAYLTATQAMQNFLALKISFSEYLEILEACGVDVEDYCDTVSHNILLL